MKRARFGTRFVCVAFLGLAVAGCDPALYQAMAGLLTMFGTSALNSAVDAMVEDQSESSAQMAAIPSVTIPSISTSSIPMTSTPSTTPPSIAVPEMNIPSFSILSNPTPSSFTSSYSTHPFRLSP